MHDTVTEQYRNILILGAGELGMAMINGFLHQRQAYPDRQITVLLRPESVDSPASPAQQLRLKQFAEWEINTITADFNTQSIEALAAVFAPYDAIINCSGFVGGAGTQLKISRAVLLAGVARYFPWQFGVDYDQIGVGSGQPVWDEQLAVRQLLRAQDKTKWVIVSTGMFTSFLFEESFGLVDIAGRRVTALGQPDYALTLTTPEDIGLLTAKIFYHQPTIENQVVYIAGDTVTYQQLTDLLSQHYAVPFALEVKEVNALQLAVDHSPDNVSAAYQLAFARADGVAWQKSRTYNAHNAIPVTDIKHWLSENKRAF